MRTHSLCHEEESVRVSLDVVGRCTNRPPLFQASAGLVTGQSKNTQSCWPAKFKPHLSYSIVLQNGNDSLTVPYALACIHMFSYLSIFVNIESLFRGAALLKSVLSSGVQVTCLFSFLSHAEKVRFIFLIRDTYNRRLNELRWYSSWQGWSLDPTEQHQEESAMVAKGMMTESVCRAELLLCRLISDWSWVTCYIRQCICQQELQTVRYKYFQSLSHRAAMISPLIQKES